MAFMVVAVSAFSASLFAGSARAKDEPEPPTGKIKMTEQRTKICARAEKRYKKLYPDAKEKKGEVVVKLHKKTFCPPNIEVKAGTTVRWVNVDKRTSHSVWLRASGVKESERLFSEEDWKFTFPKPGEFPYLCGPHWKDDDMRGSVTVVP